MSLALTNVEPVWGENFAPGMIGFVGEQQRGTFGELLVNKGIAYCTRDGSPISITHVLVVTGEDSCVEAMANGVVINPLKPYFDSERPLFLKRFVGWTPEKGKQVALNAGRMVGLPYGYGLIVSDALAGTLMGRMLNRLLHNLPNRLVSRLADWRGLAPVCSVVAAESMHPVEPAVLERGLVDVVGAIGCLVVPSMVTPQCLFDDRTVFPG